MGIGFIGNAMRRPAGVADADEAIQRLLPQFAVKVHQLAFGPAAVKLAFFERRNTGGIIAAVF